MASHSPSGGITSAHLWDFVLYIIFIAGTVLLFTGTANGQVVEQVETREINSIIPTTFVAVQGDVDFSTVLPGYNYERVLSISLNLPQASLTGLVDSNVTVFVKLSTLKGDGSAIVFETDAGQAKLLRFSLVCNARNSTCVESSIMSKIVKVKFSAPKGGYPYVDRVVVNSSLEVIPLAEIEEKTQEILANIALVEKKIGELKKAIASAVPSANLSSEFSALNDSISQAVQSAKELKINEALVALADAEGKLNLLERSIEQGTKASGSKQTGMFTGVPFIDEVSRYWEFPLVLSLCFVAFCVYIYHKGKNDRKKSVNIDKFMRENE